jgi:transcriptional regulator
MYTPTHFAEFRPEVLYALMRAHPLATLVLTDEAGALDAHHLPLLLQVDAQGKAWLRGHVARANPLWRQAQAVRGLPVLAIFQGAQAYISPNWYASKAETHRAVPTWNYAVVHAHATLRAVDDAAWLRTLLTDLTAAHEAHQPQPWQLSDAPADYLERMLAAVGGIELDISQLSGKWKVSQNQAAANRAGVVAGLRQQGSADAAAMAALVQAVDQAPPAR